MCLSLHFSNRQASQLFRSPNTNDSGRSPNCPKETVDSRASGRVTEAVSLHPAGAGANSEPLVSGLSYPAKEQEALSTSDKPQTPVRQRAVSQQTSVDISSTTSPPSKVRKCWLFRIHLMIKCFNRCHMLYVFFLSLLVCQRAVSQQTSFDLSGPHNLSGRVKDFTKCL